MSSQPIRILLADDHAIVREAWKSLLENNPRFTVVADCENGEQAMKLAASHLPDILLVDLNMSPGNGFDVARYMTENHPAVRVIGLSVSNQPKYAIRMLKLGARGYLTKTSPLDEINTGILEVFEGKMYICEEVKLLLPPDSMD